MKKLLILTLVLAHFCSQAQVAVKFLDFQPRGNQAFFMKRNFAGEVMYLSKFKKKIRQRFGIEIVSLHPRLDTFNLTTTVYDNQGTVICPAYLVFNKYNMYTVFLGFDRTLISNKSFIGYTGIDISIGQLVNDYTQYNEDRGGTILFHNVSKAKIGSIRLKVGCEYLPIEKLGIFAEITPSFTMMDGNIIGNYFFTYDIGIGVHYFFVKQ